MSDLAVFLGGMAFILILTFGLLWGGSSDDDEGDW